MSEGVQTHPKMPESIEKPYFQVQSPSAVRNRLRRETYWTKSYDNISKYPFSTQFMVDAQSRTYQPLHIMPARQHMSAHWEIHSSENQNS